MKKMITRWAAAILMLGSIIPLSAQQKQFEYNGINYEYLNANTVKVVARDENPYTGEIVIPDYVTDAGDKTKKLKVTTIGFFAFSECEITSVKFPKTLKCIENQSFNSSALKEVIIPYGVETIGVSAFAQCQQLEKAVLPATVYEIGNRTFSQCTKLSKLVLLMDHLPTRLNEKIDVFGGPEVVTSLTIYTPEKGLEAWKKFEPYGLVVTFKDVKLYTPRVNRITYEVISGSQMKLRVGDNTGLQNEAVIPEPVMLDGNEFKVTEIKDNAFLNNTSLRKVVLPASIEKLGAMAFGGCSNLLEVTSLAEVPPVCPDDAFDNNTYQNAKLYTPADYVYTYKKAAGWCKFNKVEAAAGVGEITTDFVKVYAAEGSVVVKGVTEGMPVSVYNGLGSLVTQGYAVGEETRLDVPQQGIYLVRVGGRCYKVLVK